MTQETQNSSQKLQKDETRDLIMQSDIFPMLKGIGKAIAVMASSFILLMHFTIGAAPLDKNIKDPINKFITAGTQTQNKEIGNIENFSYLDCKNPKDTQITSTIELDGHDSLQTGLSTFKPLKILNSEGLTNHILNWIGDHRLILVEITNNKKSTKGLMNILEWNRFKERSCSIEREVGHANIESKENHKKFQNYANSGKIL